MPTANYVMEHGEFIQSIDTYGIAFDIYQLGSLRFRIRHKDNGDSVITLRGEM